MGPIPASLAGLRELTALVLFNNKLSGSVPSSLVALTRLTTLHVQRNPDLGAFPAALLAQTGHKALLRKERVAIGMQKLANASEPEARLSSQQVRSGHAAEKAEAAKGRPLKDGLAEAKAVAQGGRRPVPLPRTAGVKVG